jgi:hypothetical protein
MGAPLYRNFHPPHPPPSLVMDHPAGDVDVSVSSSIGCRSTTYCSLHSIREIDLLPWRRHPRERPFPAQQLPERDYILTTTNLGSIGINLNYNLAEVPDHAAPPVIALHARNNSSSASMFAFDRLP